MKAKHKYIFIIIELSIYVCFISMDLFSTNSTYIKYAGIVLCFVFSIINKQRLKSLAFALTLIADYFLLVINNYYPTGIIVFISAQLVYHVFLGNINNYKVSLFLGFLFLSIGLIVLNYTLGLNTLSVLALVYFSNLLVNVYMSYYKNKVIFLGFVLFVFCDACVGLHNVFLTNNVLSVLMWVFYLPSQVLISLG